MVKNKSFETHWQLFACLGAVSLIVGFLILFLDISAQSLVAIAAATLLFLGAIDLVHLFVRRRHQEGWGISLLVTSFEILVGGSLLITTESERFWQILILAAYAFGRGVFDLVFAFKSIKDSTDKFIWAATGVCGCIIGFVILNSGSFAEQTLFAHIFGTYMMIFGLSNFVYGIHNRSIADEDKKSSRRGRRKSSSVTKAKPSVRPTDKAADKSSDKAETKASNKSSDKSSSKSSETKATTKTAAKSSPKDSSKDSTKSSKKEEKEEKHEKTN